MQIKAGGMEIGQSETMKIQGLSTLLLATAIAPFLLTGCGKPTAATAPPAESAALAAAPFTGQIHEIKMRGTPQGYSFEPKETTIKSGDKVRFVLVDGGPHNVSFNSVVSPTATKIPEGAKIVLEGEGKLVGAFLQVPGQNYEIAFNKNLPAGEYNFVCDPHTMLGMKGKITVTP